jgi:hypothetical protein
MTAKRSVSDERPTFTRVMPDLMTFTCSQVDTRALFSTLKAQYQLPPKTDPVCMLGSDWHRATIEPQAQSTFLLAEVYDGLGVDVL